MLLSSVIICPAVRGTNAAGRTSAIAVLTMLEIIVSKDEPKHATPLQHFLNEGTSIQLPSSDECGAVPCISAANPSMTPHGHWIGFSVGSSHDTEGLDIARVGTHSAGDNAAYFY